jgi:hypothetical protein
MINIKKAKSNCKRARLRGNKRYKGRGCPHCKGNIRYVSNQACCVCTLKRRQRPDINEIERIRSSKRYHAIKHTDEFRNKWMMRQYDGFTINDFKRMIEEQHRKCFLCDKKLKLVIDHNHKTGKVRKLLCSPCNLILGKIEKFPELIKRMFEYLKGFQNERKDQ